MSRHDSRQHANETTTMKTSLLNEYQNVRLVQAANRIEADCTSKPFHFDIFRLMSILYNHQQHHHHQQRRTNKTIKVKCSNRLLYCESDPFGWQYRVRLAANCFEQNLAAVPFDKHMMTTAKNEEIERDESNHSIITMETKATNGNINEIRIVLCTIRPIVPNEELCFWPSFDLNLALNIPFLRPSNIINEACYICTACGKCYTQPNPLKIHLKFACPMTLTNVDQNDNDNNNNIVQYCLNTSNSSITTTTTTNTSSSIKEQQPQLSTNSMSSVPSSSHRKLHNCTYCGMWTLC